MAIQWLMLQAIFGYMVMTYTNLTLYQPQTLEVSFIACNLFYLYYSAYMVQRHRLWFIFRSHAAMQQLWVIEMRA